MGGHDPRTEIQKWQVAPPPVRARLIELLNQGQNRAAFDLLRKHRNLGEYEARVAIRQLAAAIEYTPCPRCGQPLRTPKAQQCFECGADWHAQRARSTAPADGPTDSLP